MTAKLPEAAFILISSHEMEDAWCDLLLASLATIISWFETNFPIVSVRFRCIGGSGAVATGLLSACALPDRGYPGSSRGYPDSDRASLCPSVTGR